MTKRGQSADGKGTGRDRGRNHGRDVEVTKEGGGVGEEANGDARVRGRPPASSNRTTPSEQ